MSLVKNLIFLIITWVFIAIVSLLTWIFKFLPSKRSRFKTGKEQLKILFFPMFFPENAGFNYRVWQWKIMLEKFGHEVYIKNLLSESTFSQLTGRDNLRRFLLKSMFKRFFQILACRKYDVIVVRRKLLPYNDYGNQFMEKLLLSINPNLILDFDDDLTNNKSISKSDSMFGRILLEDKLSFYASLRLYPRLIAGSKFLKEMALIKDPTKSEKDILILPTCVDYLKYPGKKYNHQIKPLTLGWIGSNYNQIYLDDITLELNRFCQIHPFELLVISGRPYENPQAKFKIRNIKWSLTNEVQDLYQIDVGIMPLRDDKMSQAKCGFKLLQYMGLGLVSVASAVTTNKDIVDDGINGFLVNKIEDWSHTLQKVVDLKTQFPEISSAARKKVESHFSFDAHINNFISFL